MTFITPENRYRLAAFNWLHEQVQMHGDVLPRKLLETGFYIDGVRITLLGPQGIWKPKVFHEIPLSITTVLSGPYNDRISEGECLLYKYRGEDPLHRDNVGLRKAMQKQVPLVYFYNLVKGQYLVIWPVYIVGDNPGELTFKVSADDEQHVSLDNAMDQSFKVADSNAETARRSYITSTVRLRLHQRSFRERVLDAYREQCALCSLKHRELLDAAHIIPDTDPEGEPVVTNGLSLCKLHHAAFDRNFLGIKPEYIIEVREDILKETDGPMLLHGLQGVHEKKIILPKNSSLYPDRELLERRYSLFKKAV